MLWFEVVRDTNLFPPLKVVKGGEKIELFGRPIFPADMTSGNPIQNLVHYSVGWMLAIAGQVIYCFFLIAWTAVNVIIWMIWIAVALIGIKTRVLTLKSPLNYKETFKDRDWYFFW